MKTLLYLLAVVKIKQGSEDGGALRPLSLPALEGVGNVAYFEHKRTHFNMDYTILFSKFSLTPGSLRHSRGIKPEKGAEEQGAELPLHSLYTVLLIPC